VVGKKPSLPSFGIKLSLGLIPLNHGDASAQCLCLPKEKGIEKIKKIFYQDEI